MCLCILERNTCETKGSNQDVEGPNNSEKPWAPEAQKPIYRETALPPIMTKAMEGGASANAYSPAQSEPQRMSRAGETLEVVAMSVESKCPNNMQFREQVRLSDGNP